MTPKLRLSEEARKALLSWIRNDFWLGIRRTRKSTQMMVAPKQQAGGARVSDGPPKRGVSDVPSPATMDRVHPRVSLSRPGPAMAGLRWKFRRLYAFQEWCGGLAGEMLQVGIERGERCASRRRRRRLVGAPMVTAGIDRVEGSVMMSLGSSVDGMMGVAEDKELW